MNSNLLAALLCSRGLIIHRVEIKHVSESAKLFLRAETFHRVDISSGQCFVLLYSFWPLPLRKLHEVNVRIIIIFAFSSDFLSSVKPAWELPVLVAVADYFSEHVHHLSRKHISLPKTFLQEVKILFR